MSINDWLEGNSFFHRAAVVNRTIDGWEFEVYQEDGGEFASGTAPTINQILDMMRDYLYAEYYSSNEDLSNNKAIKYILGDVSEED